MDDKKKFEKVEPYSEQWERMANAMAREAQNIYPCRTCGAPVIDGWCCNNCGSNCPQDEPEPEVESKYKDKTIVVDFDGTCVTHRFPAIGRDIGAVPVLKRLVDEGAALMLWTMRHGEGLADAVKWFADNDIPLAGINVKLYAHIYIDDAALGVPLVGNGDERPYVDWKRVAQLLWPDDHTYCGDRQE